MFSFLGIFNFQTLSKKLSDNFFSITFFCSFSFVLDTINCLWKRIWDPKLIYLLCYKNLLEDESKIFHKYRLDFFHPMLAHYIHTQNDKDQNNHVLEKLGR